MIAQAHESSHPSFIMSQIYRQELTQIICIIAKHDVLSKCFIATIIERQELSSLEIFVEKCFCHFIHPFSQRKI
jgi:hypothetical protein